MKECFAIVSMMLGIPVLLSAQGPSPAAKPTPIGAPPRSSGRVTILRAEGGHMAVSPDGKTLAYEASGGTDKFRDVFLVPMDAGGPARCLTCDLPAVPRKHVGRPSWHPDGRYLAVQAEKKSVPDELDRRCTPATGLLNDIYVIDTETTAAWPLVQIPLVLSHNTPGTLAPRFSPDGSKLLWAQRTASAGPRQGTWELRQGVFELTKEAPALTKIEKLPVTGGPAFYEPAGFDPTGRLIYFASTLNKSMEVFTVSIDGGTAKALTNNPRTWDFKPAVSPDGKRVAWASSQGLRYQPDPFEVATDFWVMKADGSAKRRLTNFHTGPESSLLTSDVRVASDVCWTPDGKAIIGLVKTGKPGTPEADSGVIVKVWVD